MPTVRVELTNEGQKPTGLPLAYVGTEPQRGIEPRSLVYNTSALPLSYKGKSGRYRDRTCDLLAVIQVRFQLRQATVREAGIEPTSGTV